MHVQMHLHTHIHARAYISACLRNHLHYVNMSSHLFALFALLRNSGQDLQSLQWLHKWEGATDGLQHPSGSGSPHPAPSSLPLQPAL